MTRQLTGLADGTFDLLVVGGGVHGLAAAYDAAQRGLRVALVERGDFGGALSFNHQRTLHGGLRSLQSADLRRARESIRERRTFARIAPHLLRPLPFLIATYRTPRRSRLAIRLGFRLDEFLGRHRNDQVVPELHLPRGRVISRAACRRLFAGVEEHGLTGGATWYDYQAVEPHRLTLAFAIAASELGAALANYVEARQALRSGATVTGMQVRDVLTGEVLDVRARLTLNATGSHAGRFMATMGVDRPFPLVRAMNLVTTRPVSELALAAAGSDGRMLTLVPWQGAGLVGTSQSEQTVPVGDAGATPDDIEGFLRQVNAAFPAVNVGPEDVALVHQGLVPAVPGRHGTPALRTRAAILDHASDGIQGAITVVGVKYTTARGVAQRAVDLALKKLGRSRGACATGRTTLPGAGIADVEAIAVEAARKGPLPLDADVMANLTRLYGTRCPGIIALAIDRPELAARVAPDSPVLKAEIVHAIQQEMALRLTDVVLRRTSLGHLRHPGPDIVAGCVEVMTRELSWSAQRALEERAALDAACAVPGVRPGVGSAGALDQP